jgi:hypothetical protein
MDGLLYLAVFAALYFLPTIVGHQRNVPNLGSIAVINAFLGWTLVGWVVALAMAVRSLPPGSAKRPAAPSAAISRSCPHCGRSMRRDVGVCPHCKSESQPWVQHAGFWWVKASNSERWQWLDETTNVFRWYPEGTPSVPSSTTDQSPSRALDAAVVSPPGTEPPIQIERQGASQTVLPASTSGELERLADLHARGVLSDEEFQQAKQRVLQG